jgi:uncharacterized membrane protein
LLLRLLLLVLLLRLLLLVLLLRLLLLVARVSALRFSFGCDCEVRQLVAVRSLEACLVALVILWILEIIELAFLFLAPCVKV